MSDTSPDHSRNTRLMAVGTLLSRVTGFGRIFALAYAIGFTRLADSYNLANVSPNIVYELVLGGVLSGTLIPVFVRILTCEEDDELVTQGDRGRALSAVVGVAAVAMVVLSALVMLAAPWLVRLYTAGHGPDLADQRAVATTLLRFFAPQVACLGAITVTTALLNARRRFAAPMFSPIVANLVFIAVLLSVPAVSDDLRLGAVRGQTATLLLLGLGTTAGFALQALVQVGALRGAGLGLRPRWEPRHPAVRRVAGLAGWTVGLTVANQIAVWVVLVLANRRTGGVSAYQAAQVFFMLPYGIVTVSVMSALQPALAERWSRGDVAGFRTELGWGLRAVSAVIVPAAVGLALLARPLITVVLEHGALSGGSARTTADVAALLALGLPFFSVFQLVARSLLAMHHARAVFGLYAFQNAVNIALALALFPALGLPGLAVAFGASYAAAMVVAVAVLGRRVPHPVEPSSARGLVSVLAATTVMAIAVALVVRFVGGAAGWEAAARVTVAIGAGVSVYLLMASTLGVRELRQLLTSRRAAVPTVSGP